MSEDDERARYAFGDSTAASQRLALVAAVFEPSTRAFLGRVAPRRCARMLDVGCGPGHTTRLLADVFPDATVVGLDQSDAFLAEARATLAGPRITFARADATAPLAVAPGDVVYSRFVLSHLRDRAAALAGWFAAVAPGGVLMVEEVESIVTPDAVLRTYLEIAAGLIADRDGDLYLGPELAATAARLGGRVLHDFRSDVSPPTGEVATIFGLNLSVWRDDPWVAARHDAAALDVLADALAARRTMADRRRIRWTLRQVTIARA